MMLDPTGKHNNIYFPPYAFESHIYLIRGDKESIEAIENFGGLSMFFMRGGPGTRPEMRKRITKFYMNKGIDINSVSSEGSLRHLISVSQLVSPSPSSTCRTLSERRRLENGLWMKGIPSLKTPWWTMTSAGYPDINRQLRFGCRRNSV